MDELSESHKPMRQNNSLFIFPLKTGDGAETSSQPAVQTSSPWKLWAYSDFSIVVLKFQVSFSEPSQFPFSKI